MNDLCLHRYGEFRPVAKGLLASFRTALTVRTRHVHLLHSILLSSSIILSYYLFWGFEDNVDNKWCDEDTCLKLPFFLEDCFTPFPSFFPHAPNTTYHFLLLPSTPSTPPFFFSFSTSSLPPSQPPLSTSTLYSSFSHPHNNLLLNHLLSHSLLPSLILTHAFSSFFLTSTLFLFYPNITLSMLRNVSRETLWCLCCQMV